MVDVQDLLQLGQERGYVTSEEIMALVEEYDMTMEEIEDLYSQLFDQSIEIDEQSPLTTGTLEPTEPALTCPSTRSPATHSGSTSRRRGRSPCSPRTRRSSWPSASRPATNGPRTG